jgi:hypothetical protein
MKKSSICIALTAALFVALPSLVAETKPVKTGEGIMTFQTVPGWGLGADGKSVLGSTHGGVVVDKAGNIYTSAQKGIVVFSPDRQSVFEYPRCGNPR